MYQARKSRPAPSLSTLCCLTLLACGHGPKNPEKAAPVPPAPLTLTHTVELPGITGDFDHLAIDLKGQRLFLAGEDHKTLEIIDLKTNQSLRSLSGFGTPHSILYLPEKDELYVADGDDGAIKILSGSDYQVVRRIKLLKGADSIGFDADARQLFVVSGGKDVPLDYSILFRVDLVSEKPTGQVRFDSNHVEAMALDRAGSRLFINDSAKNQVAVIDRKTMKETGRWTVGVAQENSPMAFDEAAKRLFIVCRKPATLVVMDSDTGAVVASFPAAARADEVAFDRDNHRIYVPGGEGFISVFSQVDANHYSLTSKVPSALGAKTALLVPQVHKFFVAVSPGETKEVAKVLIYDVAP
jgi:DNA-binding beta-propeller fold protein YncE